MKTNTSSSSTSRNGIHIEDALSILSDRAKGGGDNISSGSNSIPDELKAMGQQLDITGQMDFAKINCSCSLKGETRESATEAPDNNLEDDRHKAMKEARIKRTAEIQGKIDSMTISEALETIFQAQQERVATYKTFEKGLTTILKSGNMTNYPVLCAKITASFSVLSDTINAVKSSMINHRKRNDIGQIITQLQRHESEKLNLTAAWHLERLRLNNSTSVVSSEKLDDKTVRLLRQGVASLEGKISRSAELINDTIDELRCIMAEEMG
mmetsp:Transcript_26674/g.55567  ORF Transcript_26674/g.55567 Transcript_26674/m.55567 type:complete len:268 (+) Transcript_26674:159-962(+)